MLQPEESQAVREACCIRVWAVLGPTYNCSRDPVTAGSGCFRSRAGRPESCTRTCEHPSFLEGLEGFRGSQKYLYFGLHGGRTPVLDDGRPTDWTRPLNCFTSLLFSARKEIAFCNTRSTLIILDTLNVFTRQKLLDTPVFSVPPPNQPPEPNAITPLTQRIPRCTVIIPPSPSPSTREESTSTSAVSCRRNSSWRTLPPHQPGSGSGSHSSARGYQTREPSLSSTNPDRAL